MENKFFYKSISVFVDKDYNKEPLKNNPALLFPDTMIMPSNYKVYHIENGRVLILDGVFLHIPASSANPFNIKIEGKEDYVEFFTAPNKVYIPFNQEIVIPRNVFFLVNRPCFLFGRWRSLI